MLNLDAAFAHHAPRPPPPRTPAALKIAVAWCHLAYQQALARHHRTRTAESRARCARALREYDAARAEAEGRF